MISDPGDGSFHLSGGNVLAAPPERVACSVAEVQVAELVCYQDIT